MRRKRIGIRSVRSVKPLHNKYECEVQLAYLTISERLRLRELTENLQIAKDKEMQFELQLEKRVLAELRIPKRSSKYIEIIGGKTMIIRYVISNKDKFTKRKKKEKK